MAVNIKIENFEGPFDLLLHLIKKNKMEIADVKIYDITTQYLQYLKDMKQMDLEVTSEFIVIAATLIEIKSKLLLPKNKEDEIAVDENDPTKELINRLIEYKKFKEAAEFFRGKEEATGTVFSKKPEIIPEDDSKQDMAELFKGMTMLDLYNIFNDLINKYLSKINTDSKITKEIHIDSFKIEDKMIELKKDFSLRTRLTLAD